AGIEARDLLCVAVEEQSRTALGEQPAALADAALGCLTPARMIDSGIDVRVEAVLARVLTAPRRDRQLLRKRNADDRLDALEAVLPGHDEANRRTVLVG